MGPAAKKNRFPGREMPREAVSGSTGSDKGMASVQPESEAPNVLF